ncbi:pyridoxal-phosphate dependent enzyme [Butyrivibrio sp. CB08]|uniref:1-aminocyclopropane-1-carboxylate deaminase/D-cysteine desulfhydrase n=1 Tax=Butyrivibrio sp. CB08 TaxID=2364879 RepID=UPI000EAA52A8|nr:pyridoxal-phosphate dependent enzyme [Butyrivibrio sp. CB08]RKM59814.1 pyridoxal-phosphate dependent enzyme [Butyrivibrio sp. CB08]
MNDRTPVYKLNSDLCSNLYVKREDMIPYSFGGNKARKARLFFEEIDAGDYDYVVTYGSSHSNHCRVVANMAAQRGLKCLIIGPQEVSDETYNSRIMEILGAEIITVPVDQVSETIDHKLQELKDSGHKPYFIMGGGHGNIGTRAYAQCYSEIKKFEQEEGIFFDYIFFASGTGTTQAGLVCGQLLEGDDRKIVGISIARKNPRGRDVVVDSIRDYLKGEGGSAAGTITEEDIQSATIFIDDYTGDGYGADSSEISAVIEDALVRYGMPLDGTYTGKAFFGMEDYIKKNKLSDKTILFIHTGGTPLFFDELNKKRGK